MRHRVWPRVLQVDRRRTSAKGVYQKALAASLEPEIEHTIEVDVVRTMPDHRLFWVGGAQVGVESLRRILHAYAIHVPDIGYCQGMSSVAAMLLMHSNAEEEAFFMLLEFMERFQYTEVYRHGFPRLWEWIEQFKGLANRYVPETFKRLDSIGVGPELYADKWFITALTYNFPHVVLLRLWDILLFEGNHKVLLRAGLSVLKLSGPKLQNMQFDDVLPFLQKDFGDPEHQIMDDPDKFIRICYSFKFKRRSVESPGPTAGCLACRS
eukprot:Plantae.Rhodophyta-Rhodochaete_pulchella.ctg62169.p1 GENE.Plantae.Rhodophyta-Rhodochaete_pulchella.ctg62169~~Plantae.Rhodophyta-Rhodochaete_pulchella.ctg62169.p1  ORF type:complete len:274 (+),score=34.35 Plantae.Rhodophyta-Rhodochaete_pulchella.ctg62169:27-824(+)